MLRDDVLAVALIFALLAAANPSLTPTIIAIALVALGSIVVATGIHEGWWR